MLSICFLKNIFWSELIQPSVFSLSSQLFFHLFTHPPAQISFSFCSSCFAAWIEAHCLKTWMSKTKCACYAHMWDLNSCAYTSYTVSAEQANDVDNTPVGGVLFDHLKNYLTIWKIKKKNHPVYFGLQHSWPLIPGTCVWLWEAFQS